MFKQLWQHMRLAFAPSIPSKAPEPDITHLPILERCRVIYVAMDLTPFQHYTLQDGRAKAIMVAHPTIEETLEDLSRHQLYLEKHHHINREWVEYQNYTRPINRFLLTKDNCYLPSVYGSLSALCTAVLELISEVDRTQDTDYHSYNLRMLNALMLTLYDLGTGLMEIAEQIKSRL